jgi:glycine oxidase
LELACRKTGVEIQCGAETRWADLAEEKLVVLAAGAWASDLVPGIPKVHPVKGQMLSFRVAPGLMPPMPLHAEFVYLVPRGADRVVVGATVETVGFDKRLTGEGIEWLLQNAFETVPDLRSSEVERIWAGLRPGSSDGWPTLGPVSSDPRVHLAIGHFRRGILFLPLSVKAVVQGILKGELPEEAKAFGYGRHLDAARAL